MHYFFRDGHKKTAKIIMLLDVKRMHIYSRQSRTDPSTAQNLMGENRLEIRSVYYYF